MRLKWLSLFAAGLAASALIVVGPHLIARAQQSNNKSSDVTQGQTGNKSADKSASKPSSPDVNRLPGAEQKPDSADVDKLRKQLDSLLDQRAEIDRKIEETRKKLGPYSRTDDNDGITRRFEFRNGNGAPRVFEFNGNNMSPEMRKQMEDIQKQMRDAFKDFQFGDIPKFDFQFDGNGPDMKAFREQMQKFGQQFRDRAQQRQNGNVAPPSSNQKSGEKPANKKTKYLDA